MQDRLITKAEFREQMLDLADDIDYAAQIFTPELENEAFILYLRGDELEDLARVYCN